MADLQKTYEDLVESNNELNNKFNVYEDALANVNNPRKAGKKWSDRLIKAISDVQNALDDTERKLKAMGKALDEYVNMLKKTGVKIDKDLKDAIHDISEVMGDIDENIKDVKEHLYDNVLVRT
jgi:uncharacterized protein YicC (UPF0701 family)